VVLAAGVAGLLTAAACAFFVGSFMADGSHTGTVGEGGKGQGAIPVAVNFPSGELTPEHAVEVTATVENKTTHTVTFEGKPAVTVSSSAPGCEASWFALKFTGEAADRWNEWLEGARPEKLRFMAGETAPLVPSPATNKLMLEMKETGTDQSACEGKPVTLHVHLTEK
jgi:hypothetical protein